MDSRFDTYLNELDGSQSSDWPFRFRSPGRINLIGEHTDYTGGLVMPAAIDRSITFLVRPIEQAEWRLHALDIDAQATLQLPITGKADQLWVNYLAGIGVQFQDQGHFLPGLEIVFGGNLPSGAGVSSSAALEGGMAFLLNELLDAKLSRPELAQLCKRSSNQFLGIPSGIMDQFASLNGIASGPIVLNCHTLEFEPVANKINGYIFLLANSMVTHELGSSEYPVRVRECEAALSAIRREFPEVDHLSAATDEQLSSVSASLAPVVIKRARYVIHENQRVRRAINALESGSATEFGQLLNATHAGLRDEYEVSCPEIDFLQQEALTVGGVAGARLMGGGFGGCIIILVREEALAPLKQHLSEAYQREYDLEPEFYPVRIAAGTERVR